MPINTAVPSAELLAGQNRLLELREKFGKSQRQSTRLAQACDHGRFPSPSQPSFAALPQKLPSHLGWGSELVTAVVRKQSGQPEQAAPTTPLLKSEPKPKKTSSQTETVKLYPDVALGLLESGRETAGRIWLLLRHLDNNGRGWLSIAETKQQLSKKSSPLRVCGWRQLRNLLNEGETIFWQRRNGRVWLQSLTKVAHSLGVSRLKMRPVTIPLTILTQSIGKVRAHFYATFHSSRTKSNNTPTPEKPISRSTISQLTHVQVRTQRRYEKIARVRKQRNYAVAGKASKERMEEQSWQHGRACFKLTDYKGLQGNPGNSYTAWQLPNSYVGPHQLAPKGKQQRINQALSDLFMKGMTGNGQSQLETRYFANGRLAAKAHNRQSNKELYWYDPQLKAWHFLKS